MVDDLGLPFVFSFSCTLRRSGQHPRPTAVVVSNTAQGRVSASVAHHSRVHTEPITNASNHPRMRRVSTYPPEIPHELLELNSRLMGHVLLFSNPKLQNTHQARMAELLTQKSFQDEDRT